MLKISKGRVQVRRTELLANSAAAADYHVFGLPNSFEAVTDERGWTVIPFGLWPHEKGYQRFGQREAESVVGAFKATWARFKRAICGLPVFKGHPDNPDMANMYPDRTEYGQVSDMEVRDDGLAIKHVVSERGATLVANGYDRVSPNWYVHDTGEKKNDRPVFEVVSIKSIGLVKKPNIPNLSLVNAAHDPMKALIIAALAKLGITLANEAEDAQVVAAVEGLGNRPSAQDHDALKNQLAVANAKVTTLTSERDTEKARADAGATALANEKKTKVDTLIANAIKDGRITPADKATWESILANEAGEKILAALPKKVKTKPQVTGGTARQADTAARREFSRGRTSEAANGDDGSDPGADGNATAVSNARRIEKLVNDHMASMRAAGCKETGNALRDKAWANIKSRHPNLFKDGAKTPGDDGSEDEDNPS